MSLVSLLEYFDVECRFDLLKKPTDSNELEGFALFSRLKILNALFMPKSFPFPPLLISFRSPSSYFELKVYFDLLKKHVDSRGLEGSADSLPRLDHAELLPGGQRDAGVKGRRSWGFGEVFVALPFPTLLLPRQCPGQFAPHGPQPSCLGPPPAFHTFS